MEQTEIEKRADQIEAAIKGLELMEAVDAFGQAINNSSKKGQAAGDQSQMEHIFIGIYYVARLVNEMHGRKGIVAIKDDGGVSFAIEAGKSKKKIM